MARWIHGQPAARTQWASRREHRLGLLGERDHLVVTEPESHARRVVVRRGARLGALLAGVAGRRLAGHKHEHLSRFVIPEAHLTDLPLGLARLRRSRNGLL